MRTAYKLFRVTHCLQDATIFEGIFGRGVATATLYAKPEAFASVLVASMTNRATEA
jgi:hypothetical protein